MRDFMNYTFPAKIVTTADLVIAIICWQMKDIGFIWSSLVQGSAVSCQISSGF